MIPRDHASRSQSTSAANDEGALQGLYDELHEACFRARSIVHVCQRQGGESEGALAAAFSELSGALSLLETRSAMFGYRDPEEDHERP